jgi:hypothetical protein
LKNGHFAHIITLVQAKFPTIYANVVNVRSTKSELIMDFAYVVETPEKPLTPPAELAPELRVMLSVSATRKLAELLLRVAQQQEQATPSNNTADDIAEKA